MATSDKLNYLIETKNAIKTSLQNKGIEVTDTDTFRSYANKIDSIETGSSGGGDINEYFPTEYKTNDSEYAAYWLEKYQLQKQPPAITIPSNASIMSSLQNFARSYKAKYIPKINFGNFVDNISYMYGEATHVESIDTTGWNTENVTTMRSLFYYTTHLKEIIGLENLNTSKVTNMNGMFHTSQQLSKLNLSNFDTSNVTDISYMFYDDYQYVSIGPGEDYDINVANWNTSKVTNMSYMLALNSGTNAGFLKLKTVNLSHFDTSELTDVHNLFQYQRYLENIDLSNWNTSKVTNMNNLFDGCDDIVTLDIGHFDMGAVTSISYIFRKRFTSLTANLTFGYNLGKGYTRTTSNYSYYTLDVSSLTELTHDSLLSIINGLYDLNLTYDVANGGTLYTQQLKLGATNKAKLTEEELVIATAKGWNIS